ncbi:MAG: DUF4388 domain-containing protein [Thermoanaerobaculales bacterium]|nr:DUF4388 domain-containing protein [Thermoanaerobaculales bacterium]
MTIAGNLRTMGLADIMQWLSTNDKTGTLLVHGPDYTKKVYFRRGGVVAVASDNAREMLGYYLVGWGFCQENQLRAMVGMQDETQTMLGKLAVRQGYVSEEDLETILVTKTRETIYDLMLWDAGEFRFIESDLPDRSFIEIQLPAMSFLFEGARQRDERQRMRQVIPDGRCIPALICLPEDLDPRGTMLLQMMDGRRSVEDIALMNRMSEFDIMKLVYSCVSSGAVQVLPPSTQDHVPGHSDAPWFETEKEVHDRIGRGRFLDALKLINGSVEKLGKSPGHSLWTKEMFSFLETALAASDISESDLLEANIDLDELLNLECDPAEGFVLSRINGSYSLGDILKQLPGSDLNNRIIIHNLIRRNLVKVRQATAVRPFHTGAGSEATDDPFVFPDQVDSSDS